MTSNPSVFSVSIDDFQQQVVERSQEIPVLVDFWADWCAPCKQILPLLEKLVADNRFVLAKVNADQEQALVAQFGIRSLPTVKLVIKGKVVDQFSGALTESQLSAFLDKHIANPGQQLLAKAKGLRQQGETQHALELLTEANRLDHENFDILLEIAAIKLLTGQTEEAEAILTGLPQAARDRAEYKQIKSRLRFASEAENLPSINELKAQLAKKPENGTVLCQLGLHCILAEDFENGIESLFVVLHEGAPEPYDRAKKILIELFDMLGAGHPLVRQYRRQLYALLH